MMGSESSLWKTLNKNMQEYWVAERIENLLGSGTPDVNFTIKGRGTSGWIELKHVHSWPKRKSTILKVPHFTKAQKNFLARHGRAGGRAFILLQVDRDYMLFSWREMSLIGIATKDELIKWSYHWKNSIEYDKLKQMLGFGYLYIND